MEKLGTKVACHDFNVLREVMRLTGIVGEWIDRENHCQFRAGSGAVLNYWKSTGRIYFQGPDLAATELEAMFLRRAVIIRER